MQIRLLLCAAFTSLIASSALSQGLKDGLVGYYDFESDFSNDSAASGPDGTSVDGATAGADGGVSGKGLQLGADTGSNQHMNVEIDFGEASTLGDTFTLSAWYNLNDEPADNGTSRYFVFEGSDNFDVSYGLRDLGTGEPGINDGQAFTEGQSLNISDAALEGWQHVLQTYSADGGTITITTYINGDNKGAITVASANFGGAGFNFGAARNSASDRGFDGLLDEIAIWDRALTAVEIASVYTLGLNSEPVLDPPLVAGEIQLGIGLVGYYDFESDFSNDSAASGPAGTSVDGATAGADGGVSGNALLLDTDSNQHMNLELGFGEASPLGDTFTLSAWYNLNEDPTVNETDRYFVFEGSDNFDISYGLRDLGLGEFGINDGQVFTQGQSFSVSDAALNGWHHVLQTYTEDEGTITITSYVDGTNVGSITLSSASFGGAGMNFGAARNSETNRGFDGLMDEIAIWDRALSAIEIVSVYALGLSSSPVVDGNAPATAPTISFSASPLETAADGKSTLSWDVSGATSVTIIGGIGSVDLAGSQEVTLKSDRNYTLVAINGTTIATAQVSVSLPVAPAQLSAGLVGYYSFESDLTNDPAASGPDGVAVDGATAGAEGGVVGNGLLLSTETNQHMNLEIGFGEDGILGDAFTISTWYNINAEPEANGTSRYFVFESQNSFHVSYGLRDLGLGDPGFNDGQAFTGNATNTPIGDAGTGDWRHVLQTYAPDEDSGVTTITTYIDGVSRSTLSSSTAAILDSGLNFGAPRDSEINRGFDGLIDEVALWSRTLTSEEIAKVFELGSAGVGILSDSAPFEITSISIDDAGDVTIEFSSVPGKSYTVDQSEVLQGWNELNDNVPSQGDTTTFTHSPDAGASYYRVRLTE